MARTTRTPLRNTRPRSNPRPINRCAAAYAKETKAAEAKLDELRAALRHLNCRANFDDRNYGFVGNAEFVNEKLDELLSFLGR